jgi:hypothetical protein
VLKTVARQRLHASQDTLDLEDGRLGDDEAPIVSSQARHLWEALSTAYQVLGLDRACGRDEMFTLLTPGPGDRANEQAGLDPGVDRGRDRRTVVSHDQAAAAGLCNTGVA